MSRKKKYAFSSEIQVKLEGFKIYLENEGLSKATIEQKQNYTGHYLSWLVEEYLREEEVGYNNMLDYIDYCREEGKSKKHINTILGAIRGYYKYLQKGKPYINNPALNIKLKGIRKKLPTGIIAYNKLEAIYHDYPETDNRRKRNKLILGLLIYQGLSTGELTRLETRHINLKEGNIYIIGNRKRNSRTLKLEVFQILEINDYISHTRKAIIREINKASSLGKQDKLNHEDLKYRLIISTKGSKGIKNILHHLFSDLQKYSLDLKNATQIRSSLITHWLKHYNLREVQYMAGHKYVSSTERYNLNKLDNLKSKLTKYHPLDHIR